jgi:3-hydroxyacyl-CoA dehydrogenase/enoyl-CoA hydratase/3-hydroxybutyryl-CoA epimerase
VIEAVFEDLELKRRVLAQTEAIVSQTCVIASNTSALPIGEIAAHAAHPERILGMHYFSPVPRMPLLEIVVTPKTSAQALSTARAYGAAQGKAMIVVKDSPGFYTTRILSPYLNEALALLDGGASVSAVDEELVGFGFPLGPLGLLDEVGLAVGEHVSRHLGEALAYRGLLASSALSRMIAAGLSGKRNGGGFYVYERTLRGRVQSGGVTRRANPAIDPFFGGPRKTGPLDPDDADRPVLAMVNEAAVCLEEGVIGSPLEADLGAVLGLGFPAARGGPLRYVDEIGAAAVVARLKWLESRVGPRFRPSPLLEKMAAEGGTFHASRNVADA